MDLRCVNFVGEFVTFWSKSVIFWRNANLDPTTFTFVWSGLFVKKHLFEICKNHYNFSPGVELWPDFFCGGIFGQLPFLVTYTSNYRRPFLDAEVTFFTFFAQKSFEEHFPPISLAGLLLGRRDLLKNDDFLHFWVILLLFWSCVLH